MAAVTICSDFGAQKKEVVIKTINYQNEAMKLKDAYFLEGKL